MQGASSAKLTDEDPMKKTFRLIFAAAFLAITPAASYAAGSSNDTSSSNPSVSEMYRDAVRAVKAKEFRMAIKMLNKVIDEQPRHPDALNYLGFSHRKMGDYARGVSYYKKALSLDAEHRGANEYLGQAYVELGNIAGAEKQLASLEKICGTRCDEYKSLKQAIDSAKARNAKQG